MRTSFKCKCQSLQLLCGITKNYAIHMSRAQLLRVLPAGQKTLHKSDSWTLGGGREFIQHKGSQVCSFGHGDTCKVSVDRPRCRGTPSCDSGCICSGLTAARLPLVPAAEMTHRAPARGTPWGCHLCFPQVWYPNSQWTGNSLGYCNICVRKL